MLKGPFAELVIDRRSYLTFQKVARRIATLAKGPV
jgi:hypothetical protein